MTDYTRCCVVCLAERGITQHELTVEPGKFDAIVEIPVCENHWSKHIEIDIIEAEPARWITRPSA